MKHISQKPGLLIVVALGMVLIGAIVAHQSKAISRQFKPMSLISGDQHANPPSEKIPKELVWHEAINVDQATPVQNQLIQSLASGVKIQFTLNPHLQAWAKKYLSTYQVPYGSMVMMDVASSRILAMTGYSNENTNVDATELCLTPWAPAASVFKLVTAAALLEKGVLGNRRVCYHQGKRVLTREHFLDDPRRDKTCDTLESGIAKSINPVLGKLAYQFLDKDMLEKWSRRFGFERPIPFDLPVKSSTAAIPTSAIERAQVAAGFWKTNMSVLHGALIANAIATGGVWEWPAIIQSVHGPNGKNISFSSRPKPERIMSRTIATQLTAMMVQTTLHGTGRQGFFTRKGIPFLPNISVAGKTGSLTRSDPFIHYNWFVGFAPAEKPEVAFAVLLGNPEKWRIKASTAARAFLGEYLSSKSHQASPR